MVPCKSTEGRQHLPPYGALEHRRAQSPGKACASSSTRLGWPLHGLGNKALSALWAFLFLSPTPNIFHPSDFFKGTE